MTGEFSGAKRHAFIAIGHKCPVQHVQDITIYNYTMHDKMIRNTGLACKNTRNKFLTSPVTSSCWMSAKWHMMSRMKFQNGSAFQSGSEFQSEYLRGTPLYNYGFRYVSHAKHFD